MGFLRRLLGGAEPAAAGHTASAPEVAAEEADVPTAVSPTADEAHRDVELARSFHAGLSEMQERQLRYQQYAWQPPGEHQGEPPDEDAPSGEPDLPGE